MRRFGPLRLRLSGLSCFLPAFGTRCVEMLRSLSGTSDAPDHPRLRLHWLSGPGQEVALSRREVHLAAVPPSALRLSPRFRPVRMSVLVTVPCLLKPAGIPARAALSRQVPSWSLLSRRALVLVLVPGPRTMFSVLKVAALWAVLPVPSEVRVLASFALSFSSVIVQALRAGLAA